MNTSHLSILVAMARNRVIGKDNTLPWYLPADLRHFKALTLGNHIIMGRKTYESIGKPLPGRTNIIITRQVNYHAPGAIIVNSVDDALRLYTKRDNRSAQGFIIGGAELYQQTLGLCQRIYMTELQHNFEGDTFFPNLNPDEWNETIREKHYSDGKDPLEFHFIVLDRKI